MNESDVETGDTTELLPQPPPKPCGCCHRNQEDNTSPHQGTDYTIHKLLIGIILTILAKYWYITGIVLIGIIVSCVKFGMFMAFIILFLSFIAVFYQVSDQLVYWPNIPPDSRSFVNLPSAVGLPSENLYLYAKDGTKIHAVFIKQGANLVGLVPTFIYFHGNAGNIGHRLSNVYGLYRYLGINLLMVEYRGYGFSSGTPSERGLSMDAQAAVLYLKTRTDIDQSKIIVYGRSLGGAVAIDIVSRSEFTSRVAGLVVENTFTSIPDMARTRFSKIKMISSLPQWFHKNKFLSKLKMCRIVVPTLLLSGQSDNLVPPKMMTELYQTCPAVLKRLYQFANGSHNETWKCSGYYQAISHFLQEVFLQSSKQLDLPPGVVCISEPQVL